MKRNKDYRPVAGLIRSERPWIYQDTHETLSRCAPRAYLMASPWTAEARGLARHEMAHVAWSPLKRRKEKDRLVEKWALVCEDARVNMLSRLAGLSVALPLRIDVEAFRRAFTVISSEDYSSRASPARHITARLTRLELSLARSGTVYNENANQVLLARDALGARDSGILDHVRKRLVATYGATRTKGWRASLECGRWLAEYERWLRRAESPEEKEKGVAERELSDAWLERAPEASKDKYKGKREPQPYLLDRSSSDIQAALERFREHVETLDRELERTTSAMARTEPAPPIITVKPSGLRHHAPQPMADIQSGLAGRMSIHYAHLTERVRGRGHNRVAVEGTLPTAWHRYATDGRIFRGPGGRARGTLLVDVSGSMSFSQADLALILRRNVNRTVAVYGAATHDAGTLSVIATCGRSVRPDRIMQAPGIGSGNVVDVPALRWLARQHQPLRWLSDGMVTGVRDCNTTEVSTACREILRASTIKRVPLLSDLSWSRDSRPSLDVSRRGGRVS